MAYIDTERKDARNPTIHRRDHGFVTGHCSMTYLVMLIVLVMMACAVIPVVSWSQLNTVSPLPKGRLLSASRNGSDVQASSASETVTTVSKDDTTDAGEPITYPTGVPPEVTAAVLTVPPGGKTEWMTHPVPGYVYVLQGTLTVEFQDGHHLTFQSGQGFLQARTKWHRGVNHGTEPLRFLAVFFGAKGVPIILHPPNRSMDTAPR